MSILIARNTRVITKGLTGKPGQSPTRTARTSPPALDRRRAAPGPRDQRAAHHTQHSVALEDAPQPKPDTFDHFVRCEVRRAADYTAQAVSHYVEGP
mgnify:CR=1 FL=1